MTEEELEPMKEGPEAEVVRLKEALENARGEAQRYLEAVDTQKGHIQGLEETLSQLQGAVAARDGELAAFKEQMATAAAKYRDLILSAAPEVPEEMVQGATVAEIEASFAQAQGVVDKVKRQVEARLAVERVPTGAPPRTPPDLSSLSPREKIAYALGR